MKTVKFMSVQILEFYILINCVFLCCTRICVPQFYIDAFFMSVYIGSGKSCSRTLERVNSFIYGKFVLVSIFKNLFFDFPIRFFERKGKIFYNYGKITNEVVMIIDFLLIILY